MGKNIHKYSMCGLDCATCPSFIAHQNDDEALRVKTAKKWAIEYSSSNLKPEDINCLGCHSLKDPIFNHCKVCEIRKCGMEKGVKNCVECVEYKSCQIISRFHEIVPGAKNVCEKIAKKATSHKN